MPKKIYRPTESSNDDGGVRLGKGQWPYQYVWCRAYQHSWDDRGWLMMIAADKTKMLSNLLTCDCSCEREDFREKTNRKLHHRTYAAPVGYPTMKELSKDEALALLMAYDLKRKTAADVA